MSMNSSFTRFVNAKSLITIDLQFWLSINASSKRISMFLTASGHIKHCSR